MTGAGLDGQDIPDPGGRCGACPIRPRLEHQPGQNNGAAAIRLALASALRTAALTLALALAGGTAAAQSTAETPAGPAAAAPPIDEVDPSQPVSETVIDLAAWVISSGDSSGLPFAVLDKQAAQLIVFGPNGKVRGLAPALIGSAIGDRSAPGVGDRELKNIPAKDRTTPAGRFIAAYGPAAGGEKVLWIDYETAVSIHATPDTDISRKEQRAERLATPEPDDNRISHGCINVSPRFYDTVVSPLFSDGGIFYVLPESAPLETAFPGFRPPGATRAAAR